MKPRRVVILKPSALGDIVHALPVLTALREHWPEAHLSWVVNRGFVGLLEGHPSLDEVIPFDRAAFRGGVLGATKYAVNFMQELRRKRFDLVIDLQGLLRTGLMAAFSGSPVRVGFANAREGSVHAYTHAVDVPDAEAIHAVERYLRVATCLGATVTQPRFDVPISHIEHEAIHALIQNYPRPWVAVAPGAKWLTKRWPTAHFATLLRHMHTKYQGTVILVGGPEDAPLAHEVMYPLTGKMLDLTGKTSLPRLAALLQTVDVMLANDTGPLHLAAALGTKCVAPYTCTKIAKHGPHGYFDGAISTSVPCAGSYLRVCPHGLICFNELAPDRLLPNFEAALASCRTNSKITQ